MNKPATSDVVSQKITIGNLTSTLGSYNFEKLRITFYSLGWFMKFAGHNLSQEEKHRRNFAAPDEKLLQKPVFTNYYKYRAVGDLQLSQYEIVLMTHKHSVGKLR